MYTRESTRPSLPGEMWWACFKWLDGRPSVCRCEGVEGCMQVLATTIGKGEGTGGWRNVGKSAIWFSQRTRQQGSPWVGHPPLRQLLVGHHLQHLSWKLLKWRAPLQKTHSPLLFFLNFFCDRATEVVISMLQNCMRFLLVWLCYTSVTGVNIIIITSVIKQ